jgi:hypothetical protein
MGTMRRVVGVAACSQGLAPARTSPALSTLLLLLVGGVSRFGQSSVLLRPALVLGGWCSHCRLSLRVPGGSFLDGDTGPGFFSPGKEKISEPLGKLKIPVIPGIPGQIQINSIFLKKMTEFGCKLPLNYHTLQLHAKMNNKTQHHKFTGLQYTMTLMS